MNRRSALRPRRSLAPLLLTFVCCAAAPARNLSPQSSAAGDAKPRAAAARPSALPSADRVIDSYVKRIGGRKRLQAIADAVYEWEAAGEAPAASAGTARLVVKRTGAIRFDLMPSAAAPATTALAASVSTPVAAAPATADAKPAVTFAAGNRVAWVRASDGATRTLVDRQSSAARLAASLFADRSFAYKRTGALARTLGRDDQTFARTHDEAAYLVEFTARDNSRVRAWFGTESRLLLRVADEAGMLAVTFYDYRQPADGVGLAEPHRVEITIAGGDAPGRDASLRLALRSARYNTSPADSLFDAPRAADVDLNRLLSEVTRRQRRADDALDDYTYRIRRSETTLGKGGAVSKTSSTTYEIYVAKNGRGAAKRVLVDDRPLAPEEAAKEDAKLAARLEELEKQPPPAPKPAPASGDKEEKPSGGFAITIGDFSLRLSDIIRISEFVSPRRETFQGRECVVFDFQPRAGFRPKNRDEEVVNKLRGVIWIDAADKLVSRFEARLIEGFKVGGGLLASIRPGAALVYEGQRLPDGLWMPRFFRLNANGRALFFAEINELVTSEWSDFKRFRTSTDAGIIDPPAPENQPR